MTHQQTPDVGSVWRRKSNAKCVTIVERCSVFTTGARHVCFLSSESKSDGRAASPIVSKRENFLRAFEPVQAQRSAKVGEGETL